MDKKLSTTGVTSDIEFNTIMFEKRLTCLKDSQDSINACCHWCLNSRQHHKKIVSCWLNVLKRVKIEHRLTLFYLANDVIQYSKRRNYDFVESWGTTLQKATTMVRDEKVKHKILRIFKIWEQRGIYGDEFLADLCGLISASPSARKGDETHEFQSAYLIQKVKTCARLEADTDSKLTQLKEHNPKIQIDSELLISSLKDRAHVDDVEKEVDDYAKQMESYINALKLEIKARINLISLLTQAETQLENDKKDVKLVTTAYKTFAARVKILKKKLDEKIPTLNSPVPSPDINAPSPSPDSDIELPGNDVQNTIIDRLSNSDTLYTNAGYYNPVPPPSLERNLSFDSNNFSSFMGSNTSFNLENFNVSSLFDNNQNQNTSANRTSQAQTTNSYNINDAISSLFPSIVCPPPPPTTTNTTSNTEYQYGSSTSHIPLMPPPMPPFSKSDDSYALPPYSDTYNGNNSNYENTAAYDAATPSYQPQQRYPTTATHEQFNNTNFSPDPSFRNPEPTNQGSVTNYQTPLPVPYPVGEEYNPEEELDTWEPESAWEQPPPNELETPESPPMFEKEGYGDPVEYHDANVFVGIEDVDHRILPPHITDSRNEDGAHRAKDVDHRNLISLTGSPNGTRTSWVSQSDQDYRKLMKLDNATVDRDYRIPLSMETFKLPPPPPPPPKMASNSNTDSFGSTKQTTENIPKEFLIPPPLYPIGVNKLPLGKRQHGISPRKMQDNTESIDMDLSDDDPEISMVQQMINDDSRMRNPSPECMELPPPFPDLLDDVDANAFLDNINDNLDLEEFDENDVEFIEPNIQKPGLLGNRPHGAFPPMNFINCPQPPINNFLPDPSQDWMEEEFNMNPEFQNRDYSFRGRGNNNRGSFINRGHRGGWGNNNGNNFRGDFRGRGGRRGIRHNNNNGGGFRGNRGASEPRGNWSGRTPRGGRGWGVRKRGRGNFIGNFRGNN